MKRVAFSPLAQADINDIWEYTLSQWSERQAVTYIQNIRDSCNAINEDFFMSRPVDIRDGYFKTFVGSHVIYYQETKTDIIIIRILHKRMDVDRHL